MSQEQQAPAAAPVAEAPAAPETPVQNPEITARFTQLSKKEAAIVKEREAVKKQQAELQSKMKQIEEVNKRVQEFENLKKSNALDAIKYLGFTDTDIFNALASVPEPTPEEKTQKLVDSRIQEFQKRQQEEAAKIQAETDKKVIDNFKTNIMTSITKDASKYEFCNYHGEAAKDQVFELIETHFKDTGEVIPLNEALDTVEEFYENSAKEMSEKVSKLKLKPTTPTETTENLKPQIAPKPAAGTQLPRQPTAPTNESREAKRARLISAIKQNGLKR